MLSRRISSFYPIFVSLLILAWISGKLTDLARIRSAQAAPNRQSYPPMTVIISEVAWGGTAASSSDEWIELYNPSSTDINLSGWQLVADDGVPSIPLQGTIRAGSFFLLERSNDSTIRDIPADQIYTGALDNTGEFLHLKAPDGADVDTANADGGPWPAGSAGPDYRSMERRDLVPDSDSAWVSNDTIHRNGSDEAGNPINGTPKNFYFQWPATPTPTTTNTPTETSTPTLTPTVTDTPTSTATPSPTPTFSPTNTLTPSATYSPTVTFTATPTLTPTRTFTATPMAPSHLVISEFRSRGPGGGNDEFIEIFNPSAGSVNISGWSIKKSSGCGTSTSTLVTIPAGVILQPGQHYLVASSQDSSISNPDQTFSPGIADNGGIALISNNGAIIDQVGMCADTLYREGTPLPPLSGNINQSYARNPEGKGCYDRNNNALDFSLLSPSQPQNRSSPIAICSGVVTFTPSRTPTATPTRTPTRAPTPLPVSLVLNEILPFPRSDWNGDGSINTKDEYIEIINLSNETVYLRSWKIDDEEEGSSPYALPDRTLLPGEIARFFGSETGIVLGNGGDSVRLFHPSGRIVDAFTYPALEAGDITWCRLPNGRGSWEFTCRPTPGRPNERVHQSTPSSPPYHTATICRLPQLVPLFITLAECDSPGLYIWNWNRGKEGTYYSENRFKWPVFLE